MFIFSRQVFPLGGQIQFLDELVEYHHTASVSRSQDIKLKEMIPEEYLVQALYDFNPQVRIHKKMDLVTLFDLKFRFLKNIWHF